MRRVARPVPPKGNFKQALEQILNAPASAFDSEKFLQQLKQYYKFHQNIDGHKVYLGYDGARLAASLLLDENNARNFLLNNIVAENGIIKDYLRCLALKRLGYNDDGHRGRFQKGARIMAAYEAFLADEKIEPKRLSKYAKQVMKLGAIEVTEQKIKIAPQYMDRLASHTLGLVEYGLMPEAQRTQIRQKLAADFERAVVPQRLSGLALEGESTFHGARPADDFLMVSPHRMMGGLLASASGSLRDFQRWLFWGQATAASGATIDIWTPSPKAVYREVFIRDRYVMVDGVAYMPDAEKIDESVSVDNESETASDFYARRKGGFMRGAKVIEERLVAEGVATHKVDGWFEGGNVIVDKTNKVILAGHRFPAEKEAGEKLLEAIRNNTGDDWTLLPIPQAKNAYGEDIFYHIDLAISEEFSGGHRLFCPALTDAATADKIRDLYKDKLIEVTLQEAKTGVINSIEANGTITMSGNAPRIRAILSNLGYRVFDPLAFGLLGGKAMDGGAHCAINIKAQPA